MKHCALYTTLACGFFAVFGGAHAAAPNDTIRRAMHDELTRSVQQLALDKTNKPFYIAYEIDELEALELQASLGALSRINQSGKRSGMIDVRVGSAALDSSHVMRYPSGNSELQVLGWSGVDMPLEDDYPALRRRLWLATDQAYKRAIEDLAVKRAAIETHTDPQRLADQVPVPKIDIDEDDGAIGFDRTRAEQLVRELSAAFKEFPTLEQSEVWLTLRQRSVYFENSQGSRSLRRVPELVLGMAARLRAADGMPVWDYDMLTTRDFGKLESNDQLKMRVRTLAQNVLAMRNAERMDNYSGPVLFSGPAAGALFASQFAPRLAPQPRFYSTEANTQSFVDEVNGSAGNFSERIHSRVLPRGAKLVDDPTRSEIDGAELLTGARVDEEGVATAAKTLIDDGRLQQVLCGRAPTSKTCTPGNLRGGAVLPSNLALSSSRAQSADALHAALLKLAKEAGDGYALEIEQLAVEDAEQHLNTNSFVIFMTGSKAPVPEVLRAFKHYPDGRRVPVRNVRIADVDLRDFRDLAAIGDTPTLFSRPVSFRDFAAFSGGFAFVGQRVSYAVPPLLFEELSADTNRLLTPKLPLLKSPLATQ